MIVAVLMPTTGRAVQMLARVSDLLMQPVPDGVELWLVLAPPADDKATITAAAGLRKKWQDSDVTVIVAKREANTTAVQGWNAAYTAVRDVANWLVLGADDIVWHPDWLKNALAAADKAGAQVVGLHDGHTNLRHYGAHYMVARSFIDEHLGGVFIPPMYSSWWFDREVCEKAASLGLYVPAWDAIAEHVHPDWNNAPMDATYETAWPLHDQDREVYEQRKVDGFPVTWLVEETEFIEVEGVDATDAAVKLAKKHNINLFAITGTGTDGRIIKSDVEAVLK